MRGGTRGGGRGLSRSLYERKNYESGDYEEGDNDSIPLSQFDDIDGTNPPVRRVQAREPRQDTHLQSDYDSQRKVFQRIPVEIRAYSLCTKIECFYINIG